MDHSNHHMGHNHEDHDTYSHDQNMADMHADHDMFNVSKNFADMNILRTIDNKLAETHHDHHSAGHQHGGGSALGAGTGMMSMTFHGGYMETILFSWWNVTTVGEFMGSFFAIFIMALLYEGLKYYRKHLLWKTYSGLQYCAVGPPDKGVANICADEPQVRQPVPHVLERNVPTMLSTAHAWQTFLHGLQVLVSYMLMLVFMTYNTWLCAAVVLGSATGYFLFGWRESVVVDFTEHCH